MCNKSHNSVKGKGVGTGDKGRYLSKEKVKSMIKHKFNKGLPYSVGKHGSVSTFIRRISGSSMRAVYIFVESARRCLLCKVLDTDVDMTCFVVRGAGSRGQGSKVVVRYRMLLVMKFAILAVVCTGFGSKWTL